MFPLNSRNVVSPIARSLVCILLMPLLLISCGEKEEPNPINFAFGGAKSDDTNFTGSYAPFMEEMITGAGLPLIGLQQQLSYAAETLTDVNPDSDLFWIWVGTNDYLAGQTDPEFVSGNIVKMMRALKEQYGAKHFIIPNLVPLGYLPSITTERPEERDAINDITAKSNTSLSIALAQYREENADSTITEVDSFTIFETQRESGAFENYTEACVDNIFKGANCKKWAFYDNFHITTAVAQLIATSAYEQLSTNYDTQLEQLSRIIVFGDSYSDKGSFYDTMKQATGIGYPAYSLAYPGRFANGANTIDYLEELLGIELPSTAYKQVRSIAEEETKTQE